MDDNVHHGSAIKASGRQVPSRFMHSIAGEPDSSNRDQSRLLKLSEVMTPKNISKSVSVTSTPRGGLPGFRQSHTPQTAKYTPIRSFQSSILCTDADREGTSQGGDALGDRRASSIPQGLATADRRDMLRKFQEEKKLRELQQQQAALQHQQQKLKQLQLHYSTGTSSEPNVSTSLTLNTKPPLAGRPPKAGAPSKTRTGMQPPPADLQASLETKVQVAKAAQVPLPSDSLDDLAWEAAQVALPDTADAADTSLLTPPKALDARRTSMRSGIPSPRRLSTSIPAPAKSPMRTKPWETSDQSACTLRHLRIMEMQMLFVVSRTRRALKAREEAAARDLGCVAMAVVKKMKEVAILRALLLRQAVSELLDAAHQSQSPILGQLEQIKGPLAAALTNLTDAIEAASTYLPILKSSSPQDASAFYGTNSFPNSAKQSAANTQAVKQLMTRWQTALLRSVHAISNLTPAASTAISWNESSACNAHRSKELTANSEFEGNCSSVSSAQDALSLRQEVEAEVSLPNIDCSSSSEGYLSSKHMTLPTAVLLRRLEDSVNRESRAALLTAKQLLKLTHLQDELGSAEIHAASSYWHLHNRSSDDGITEI